MLRGTSPAVRIRFRNFDTTYLDLDRTYFTITQDNTYIEKTGADLSVDGEYLYVFLAQEDTLLLDDSQKATAQVRGVTYDGAAVATRRKTINIYGIDKEGVI